jgi:hypothetical protein
MNNEIEKVEAKAIKKRVSNVDLPANPENFIMVALQQGASIDVLERLLGLKERIQKDEAEKAFREAMSNFQAECPVIPKKKVVLNADGATTRYKYAPLDTIVKIAQPFIGKNGLSYDIETTTINDESQKGIQIKMRIFHVLGHSKETSFFTPIDPKAYMNEPQKWASAQTFAKRYAFQNGFGILTGDTDDDGNILGNAKADKKVEAENLAKLEALPDAIKEGLRLMGYNTVKAAWTFCNGYDFDNDKIKTALEGMANK